MRDYKEQQLTITQVGARAAGTIENYELKLDSEFNTVTAIQFIEVKNANGKDYEIGVNSENDVVFDPINRIARLTVANGTTLLNNSDFATGRWHRCNFDAKGFKARVGIRNVDALAGAEEVILKVIFRLEK